MDHNFKEYVIISMFLLFSLEFLHSLVEKRKLYNLKQTGASLIIGVIALFNGVITRAIMLAAFLIAYKFRIFELSGNWLVWLLCFIGADISYYWYHRAAHEIQWFWTSHVVHHSSEEFNISSTFRTSWTSQYSGQFLFWSWLPFLGFEPFFVLVAYDVCHFYQVWLHTELIKKLPRPIEYLFNTPSHHRVHHASDLKYLDKNHGGVLIIWDRIFGTFQKEEEHPVYGLTKNYPTSNPVKIVFQGWLELGRKLAKTRSLVTAIKYILYPPGWSHDGSTKTVKQMLVKSS